MNKTVKFYVYYRDQHGEDQVADVFIDAIYYGVSGERAKIVEMFESEYGDDYSAIREIERCL